MAYAASGINYCHIARYIYLAIAHYNRRDYKRNQAVTREKAKNKGIFTKYTSDRNVRFVSVLCPYQVYPTFRQYHLPRGGSPLPVSTQMSARHSPNIGDA